MAGKRKECPFTTEELREMYEVQYLSSQVIARSANTSPTTVLNWLRSADIKVRTRGIIDPPGQDWLRIKHWQEGHSLTQIGKIWADLNHRKVPFCPLTVSMWMEENDIKRRPGSDYAIRYSRSAKGRKEAGLRLKKIREQGRGVLR